MDHPIDHQTFKIAIMALQLAKRMAGIKHSEIREILKVTQQPDIISFAGGLPAPELFPIEAIDHVQHLVLQESGAQALQYTTTEGFAPLRKWIAERMNSRLGTAFDQDNVLITHGSQQGLDLAGKVFLDKDSVVLCESPTYLAAISAFKAYECHFIEIPTDDEGMDMQCLEQTLQTTENVRLIYVIPTFQNPTGKTWNLEKRKNLAALAAQYNVAVIEDNPYGELRYEGEDLPSVKSFDQTGQVLCTGSFSKIFCPGFRLGWIAGDKALIQKFVLIKQGTDLQCNTVAQMVIAKYLELYDIDDHIQKIVALYKKRRDIAISTIAAHFPDTVRFTRPEGGLFTWVVLPEAISARTLLNLALEKKIAFVPGGSFFPNNPKENTLRLNFSNMPAEKIQEGLATLGQIISNYLIKTEQEAGC